MWLSCCLQLTNYTLTHSRVLLESKVDKTTWVKLYNLCRERGESFSYLLPTVDFCIVKLGLKMISLGLIDDALYLGFNLNQK